MMKIYIDDKEIEAEPGCNIIEVADKAGIPIPRFCYHPHLSIAASCRMCLVEVSGSNKPVPACATPITEGMHVYTKSPLTQQSHRTVSELLLINHPLDCPVCDQAGECELQDLILQYGSDKSAFKESKRQVPNPDLGPLIATEMNRCIHCTRCVRFGEEIAGYPEMGGVFRGEDLKITTYLEKALESEISGNMIDICPVGALTSKPHRFGGRTWSFLSYDGWIGHDGFRVPVQWHVDRGVLKRVVFRHQGVPDFYNTTPWISDRDRFGYLGLFATDRQKEIGLMTQHEYHKISALKLKQTLQRMLPQLKYWGAIIHPQAPLEDVAAVSAVLKTAPTSAGMALLQHRLSTAQTQQDLETLLNNERPKIIIGSFVSTEHPVLLLKLRQWADNGGTVEHWSFIAQNSCHINNATQYSFAGKNLKQTISVIKKRVKELITIYGEKSVDIIISQSTLGHLWASDILLLLKKIQADCCLWTTQPYWPIANSQPLNPDKQAPELLLILQAEHQDWEPFDWAQHWVQSAQLIVVLGGFRTPHWAKMLQNIIFLPCSLLAEQEGHYIGKPLQHSCKAINGPQEAQTAASWLSQLFDVTPDDIQQYEHFEWHQSVPHHQSTPHAAADKEQALWVLRHPTSLDPVLRRSQPLQQTPWAQRAHGFWIGPDILPVWAEPQGKALTVVDAQGHECTDAYQICADLPAKTILYWRGLEPGVPALSQQWVKVLLGDAVC